MSTYLKKLVLNRYLLIVLTASQSFSQVFLATNSISSAGNVIETDCYVTTWTVGEIAVMMNSSTISGQQGYTVKKIKPTVMSENTSLCVGSEYKLTARDSIYFDSVQWYYDDIKIQGANTGIYKPSFVGNYSYKLWNQNSLCKYSSNTININSNDFQTPSISASGSPVSSLSSSPAVNYQWFVNNRLIAGQTGREYQVRYNGTYHVLVTYANGCKATSTVFVVNENEFTDITRSGAVITDDMIYFSPEVRKLSIKPNVVRESDETMINFHTNSDWAKYSIYNADGKMLYEGSFEESVLLKTATFNTSGLKSGTYFVKAFDNKGTQLEKLIIFR